MEDNRHDSPVPRVPKQVHFVAWGGLLALVLILAAITNHYDGRNVWNDWAESHEFRRPAYAERVRPEHVFRTQANTWSNLAYVVVGFYALALGIRDLRDKPAPGAGYLVRTPAMSLLFGVACCYLGFGSGLFHASLTRWGQQLDVAAMYAPLLVFIAIDLGRWAPRFPARHGSGGAPTWPLYAGLVVIAGFLLYRFKWSMRSGVVLPALILTVAGLTLLDRIRGRSVVALRWLVLSAGALVAARFCWLWDVDGRFSGPDSWLQGHAVWHLLTAVSLAATYGYYRSESLLHAPR